MESEMVVNSASLEEVVLSELGDNRAQSIQSLHSVETPTTDTTPSFDELQHRLETSNRNILNMQEQQQQLLRLQNAAKQHLNEMEQLRQQAGTLSFGGEQAVMKNGNGAPEYESIDQVHADMATLVGRMKNLTTFIQNQNELSNLLGDDGPEILAEQEALQCKLESLRAQRDEMRTLVSELQDINRNAERSVAKSAQQNEKSAVKAQPHTQAAEETVSKVRQHSESNDMDTVRMVPVTYTRNVPIKLCNGDVVQQPMANTPSKCDPAEQAATTVLIQQKVADIDTMRKQLKRLKDMMETVNLIEARTSTDAREIRRTPPPDLRSQSRSTGSTSASFERDCTPVSVVPSNKSAVNDGGGDDSYLLAKMRMINEVTSDLRAQAESLQAERDRIKALKDEILIRKQQAAAAAKLGEDALRHSSLTPTPTLCSRQQHELDTPTPPMPELNESDQLKMEYDAKKREFKLLCQRIHQDDSTVQAQSTSNNAARRRDTVSEADDEADGDEELNDSDFATSAAIAATHQYYTTPQQQSTPAQQHRAAVKAAVTAHSLPAGTVSVKGNTQTHQRVADDSVGKDDSFDTNLTSSTAGECRHSTLANATNTTQDGASLEAGSVQSGSSQSTFSMPPPMSAMGVSSSWPPLASMPNNWNPQLYYGFGVTAPHHHNVTQSISAMTTQSAGANFASVGAPPLPAVTSDCICSVANSANQTAIVAGPTPTSSSTNTAVTQFPTDPVLLQQFVQTQQMLINSVCQCNQMLWHQQREIDALNNTIHVLQERLHALSGSVTVMPLHDMPYTIRAESVPPQSLTAGSLPNNLYFGSTNRAQSEQPALFMPGMATATRNSAFSNYHQHQYQQRQQRGLMPSTGGTAASNSYNFNSEMQHHSNIAATNSTNASIYSTLNNAVPQPPPNQGRSHCNNEVAHSPPLQANAAGPGPIFMHHHNNAIHQNNANLRTQNHYANNLHQQQQQQQQQQQHGQNNISAGGGNTLNNQVPPGNRANNYWDNFRSYSRQNLLSTNSNKSNEEQQQQHYLHQRVPEQQTSATAHYRAAQPQSQPPQRATTMPTAAALTTSNLQQLQRQQEEAEQQQQQQQQQQQRATPSQSQLYRSVDDSNSTGCNNLNFERNVSNVKYLRTLQRSHINRYQQQQQQQNLGHTNLLFTNHNNLYQSWHPHAAAGAAAGTDCGGTSNDAENVGVELYDSYNIIDSDLPTPYTHLNSNIFSNSSNMLRNMNVNFGNSPHYQRNKLLTKPNCRVPEAMGHHNQNRAQQHQRMLQQQLALRVQQLDQPTLRPICNMTAYTHDRCMDLLSAPASVAVTTTEVQLPSREHIDLLLRTVTADEDGSVRHADTFNSSYVPNANELLLIDSNEAGNNTPNNTNEDEAEADVEADADAANDEEEDDTTSEEIKRNLLVNALKNDKFTTKFYESIKEDVFRRLERMLLEKESAENNCQRNAAQGCNASMGANSAATAISIDVANEMFGASLLPRDPTRKLNLNARMGNQLQQKHIRQYQVQQDELPTNFAISTSPPAKSYQIKIEANDENAAVDEPLGANESDVNNQATVSENDAEGDEDGINNADTESNKADNEDFSGPRVVTGAMEVHESEQPEEDVEHCKHNNGNTMIGEANTTYQRHPDTLMQSKVDTNDNTGDNMTNWLQNRSSNTELVAANTATANVAKKRKNHAGNGNNCGAGGDAEALPQAVVTNNSAMDGNNCSTYITDLIAYIITRIRNQTHSNTQINDSLLVEIAKLTTNAAQNLATAIGNNSKPLAVSSPKKFYMKIKKHSLPRQRDEFLLWYQNYLETIFPDAARLEAEKRRPEELRNSIVVAVAGEQGHIKLPHRRNDATNQQQQQATSMSRDNEDLAEADQNSVNSSKNNMLLQQLTDIADNVQQPEQFASVVGHMREHEFKPNENSVTDNDVEGEVTKATGSHMYKSGGGSMHITAANFAAAVAADDVINAAIQQQHDSICFTNAEEVAGALEADGTPNAYI